MKYFFHVDSQSVYSVPKKHYKYIDIIENSKSTDYEVSEAVLFIKFNCLVKLKVDAMSSS